MENFKNKYCLIAVAVGLGVGFFAGMEYKAYQIRSIFNDTAEELGNLFGDIDTGEDTKESKQEIENENNLKQAKADEEAMSTDRLRELVDVEVTDKSFTASDIMNGRYESTINFDFKFTNKTNKEVKGVQGEIVFYDIFDDEIHRTSISYDEGIPANDSNTWDASLSYNEFIDEHVKLKTTELENLKYEWVPEMVIYADGSREE